MKIYRLNVSKSDAGKNIPFDKVYLANGEARSAVKALFDYALVLPVTQEFRDMLRKTRPEYSTRYTADSHKPDDGGISWRTLLGDHDDWVCVIPILPKRAKTLLPSYLMNKTWYWRAKTKAERKADSPLPALAYLQTPERNYRPVCLACPRLLESQAGLCKLGDRVCYDTLVLGDIQPRETSEVVPDVRDNLSELGL